MAATTVRAIVDGNRGMMTAWLMYLASLALPTLASPFQPGTKSLGIEVLIIGYAMFMAGFWADPVGVLLILSWLTNIVFWLTWLLYRRARKGAPTIVRWLLPACTLINVLAPALQLTLQHPVLEGLFNNPGYYLWLGAFALASGAIYSARKHETAAI